MKKKTPVKAYKNIEFLNSPHARTVRILSEFLEPLSRFRRERIRDTIVIFGSARILPRSLAKKQLEDIKKIHLNSKLNPRKLKQKHEDAKTDYEISKYYEDAVKLSLLLTKWSRSINHDRHFVICSGGGPGIMEAANKGAIKAGGKSIGLNISLPFEQGLNPYISKNLGFEFHYFFMRKLWFVYLAKAMIMFPGGFGTMDELWEVLTLIQTKKVTKPLPIVLYGSEYWNDVINFSAMVKHRTISASDLRLIKFADTPEEAFEYLKKELIKNFKPICKKKK
ncbi:MAG: LOG family protein [Bacteroidota bacterium]|nr:LOG family protein [Bacteroidota bacterium]